MGGHFALPNAKERATLHGTALLQLVFVRQEEHHVLHRQFRSLSRRLLQEKPVPDLEVEEIMLKDLEPFSGRR